MIMKKTGLLLISLILSVFIARAQNLQESFEGSQFPPEGWEQTSENFKLGTYSSSAFHGTNYAYVSSGQDTLITPKLSVSDGDKFSLQANSGSGKLKVLISSDKTNWTVLQELSLSYGYEGYTIPLGASEAGEKYIALAADGGSYNSVYCDSINGPSIYVPAVDAGINTVVQPSGTIATGTQDVIVTLKNYGTDNLSSVNIEWSVDGTAQSTYNWSGNLSQGSTEQITLGSYNFSSATDYTITMNTDQPNGTTDGNSANNSKTITVNAVDPITAPYTENFDAVSSPELPAGWAGIVSGDWGTCETVTTSPNSSPNEVKLYNSGGEEIVLVTKPVENFTDKVLKFYARGNGEIKVGTITNNTDAATFTSIQTVSVTSDYVQYEVDFSGYSGSDNYIAFKHANASTYQSIFIDDFTWQEKSANDAAVVSVDQPTGTFEAGEKDVLVTLKNNGIDALTGVDIEWSINGNAQTTKNWTGNLSTNASEQVNLGNHDFSAGGEFTILANVSNPNGVNDENHANDTISTSVYANAPITAPYTQDFDAVNTPDIPMGWSKIENSSSGSPAVESTTSMAYTGSNSVKMYNAGDGAAGLYLVSPPIESFSGNHLKIHLGGVTDGSVKIGTMSDPSDASTFEEFASITTSYEFTEYIVDFYNYTGSDNYIAIKHGNAGTYQTIYADHFVWENVPVLAPGMHDYGYCSSNDTSAVRNFVVTNTGASEMNIASSDVVITGADPNAFFADISSDIALATGETANIPVYFTPVSEGRKEANLSVTTAKNTYTSDLSGNALPENSLIEYFEGQHFPPMGWDKPDNYNWQQKENASIEGNYSAYHSGDYYDILATPKLEINDGDSLVFMARNSTYGGSLSIMISSDGENWNHLEDISVTSTEDQHKVYFTASEAGQKYLGFKANKYIYLDAVIGPVMLEISHDASLADIMIGGESLPDFHPDTLSYEVMLSSNATSAPEVSVVTTDDGAESTVNQASSLPGFAFINVTAEDNVTEQDYEIYFDKANASDSTLSDLKVNGVTVDGFRKDSTYYSVELPYGTSEVPMVEAMATDTAAQVTFNNAAGIPGITTVEVLSADGNHDEVYTIEFTTKPAKTIAFTVEDSVTGNLIEGSTITIDESAQLITNASGEATIDTANGTYYFDVNKTGYNSYEDSVVIEGQDETVLIKLVPVYYNVSFSISDSEGPIENAQISFADLSLITNAQGQATIDTIVGDYDYQVVKNGYVTVDGTITVTNEDITETILLERKKYTLSFSITDNSDDSPIEGALITIAGRTELQTNDQGKASLDTVNGSYDYTVQKEGFEQENGTVVVDNGPVTESVALSEIISAIGQLNKEDISIYPNPSSGNFNIELVPQNANFNSVSIYTSEGRMVKTKNKIQSQVIHFNLSDLNSGLYFVVLHTDSQNIYKKIVIK